MSSEQWALNQVKETTILFLEKYVKDRIDVVWEGILQRQLREVVKEELQSLMKETESVFVDRVAEALVVKVEEKLALHE